MLDFNIVLKIIISAGILYLIMNFMLKYHVFNDIFIAGLALCVLIVLIIYNDLPYSNLFTILLWSLVFIFGGLFVYFRIKRRYFYLLLTINKSTYHRIRYYLTLNTNERVKYVYNKKRFWLLSFADTDYQEVKKIMKGIETLEQKHKTITMCNYWQIIIYLVMMVVLWRF